MIFTLIFEFIFMLTPYVSTLSPLSLSKPVTDGFGVNIHFIRPKAGEVEMIAAAGFKWVRIDFFWDATEHRKGEYNFGDYEYLMSQLEKHNISAIFILAYTNGLYGGNSIINKEGRIAYAQWAAAAVDHFKGRGIIWEIWNEPNGDTFWFGHSDVHQYIAMALEAVKAIRNKAQNEIIIGPATSNLDFAFIEECCKAGLLDYWDAISVHPYRTAPPESVVTNYNGLKRIISRYAPKDKTIPIISGEWGYSAKWVNFDPIVQGKNLPREFLSNVMNNIPISIWYDWHDDGPSETDPEHHFGTVKYEYHPENNPVYTPKEAYLSAKTMISVLNGYHYVKRIATNDSNDYIMLFRNGRDLKIAFWTLSPHSHQITIPSDKCDFEIINWIGDKNETTSSKDGSLTLTVVNDYPQYIIVKGPNHALQIAPDYNLKAIIIPAHGKELSVRIVNLHETFVNGTVR
jgi:hypothetical protein